MALVVVGCPGRGAGLEEDKVVDTKTDVREGTRGKGRMVDLMVDCIVTKPLGDAWWTVKKGFEISVFSSQRNR